MQHKTIKGPKVSGIELVSLVQSNPISGWNKVLPGFSAQEISFSQFLAFLGFSRKKKKKKKRYLSTQVDGLLSLIKDVRISK